MKMSVTPIWAVGCDAMLRIEGLIGGYHGPAVLHGIQLAVGAAEVIGILGRNGAGKSTLLRAIVGLLPETRGRIEFQGQALVGLPTHRIARLGVSYIPQGRGIFPKLSVLENLQTGTRAVADRQTGGRAGIPERVFEYFPILKQRLSQSGGTMSGGEQQMLAIARALCGRPKLLLMDEPSDGIQPNIVEMLSVAIPQIAREEKMSVLLVEQNLDLALSASQRCIAMDRGVLVKDGTPKEFEDPTLLQQHLAI
jgi:ABC-type branched-subunit amino acid transport system ATPase component